LGKARGGQQEPVEGLGWGWDGQWWRRHGSAGMRPAVVGAAGEGDGVQPRWRGAGDQRGAWRARAVRRADLGQTRGREAVLARGRDAWGGQVAPAYGAAVGRARGGAGEETGDGNFVNKPNFKIKSVNTIFLLLFGLK